MWNKCHFSPGRIQLHIHMYSSTIVSIPNWQVNCKVEKNKQKNNNYLLHFGNITNESLIIHIVAETSQLVKVPDVVLTNPLLTRKQKGWVFFSAPSRICVKCVYENRADLGNDLSQPRVAHNQPAARSDAVGLVLELVWLHFIEVLETAGKVNHHILYIRTHRWCTSAWNQSETDTTTSSTLARAVFWLIYHYFRQF